MYLYGKLYNKKYIHCIGPDKKEEKVLVYKSISGGKRCFSGSTRRVIKFAEPTTGIVKVTRNQLDETVSISAGWNILEIVSLTNAIDRQYKVFGSKFEKNARVSNSNSGAIVGGAAFGVVGSLIGASIDEANNKSSRRVQNSSIHVNDLKRQ